MTNFEEFMEKYKGLVRFYAKKLDYPEAIYDLWGMCWIMFDNMPGVDKYKEQYIAVCIRNFYISLLKKKIQNRTFKSFYNEEEPLIPFQSDVEFFDLLKGLTDKEREALIYRFYLNERPVEIANRTGTSRQNVESTILRAINKITKFSNLTNEKNNT